jgi:hypothetical protein
MRTPGKVKGLYNHFRASGLNDPSIRKDKAVPFIFLAIIQMERTNGIFSIVTIIFEHPLSAKYQSPS